MSKATYVTAPSFLDRKSNKTKYLPVPSSLANYHCSVLTFPIRSEYQNTSAFDFFLLQNTVGIENVPLSRVAMRYYRVSVTRELKLETFSGRLLYIMLAFFRAF